MAAAPNNTIGEKLSVPTELLCLGSLKALDGSVLSAAWALHLGPEGQLKL